MSHLSLWLKWAVYLDSLNTSVECLLINSKNMSQGRLEWQFYIYICMCVCLCESINISFVLHHEKWRLVVLVVVVLVFVEMLISRFVELFLLLSSCLTLPVFPQPTCLSLIFCPFLHVSGLLVSLNSHTDRIRADLSRSFDWRGCAFVSSCVKQVF